MGDMCYKNVKKKPKSKITPAENGECYNDKYVVASKINYYLKS